MGVSKLPILLRTGGKINHTKVKTGHLILRQNPETSDCLLRSMDQYNKKKLYVIKQNETLRGQNEKAYSCVSLCSWISETNL